MKSMLSWARSAVLKQSNETAFHGVGEAPKVSFPIIFTKVRRGFFW